MYKSPMKNSYFLLQVNDAQKYLWSSRKFGEISIFAETEVSEFSLKLAKYHEQVIQTQSYLRLLKMAYLHGSE